MIIGNGDIAKALKGVDRKDFIFFASGVSNSGETRESEFERERNLLLEQSVGIKKLVYFSSLATMWESNPYFEHKRSMEVLVELHFPRYTIVRLGNIDWGDNPHTIINFFRNQVAEGNKLNIQNGYRHVVGKKEFQFWMNKIPDWNCEMNITGKFMTIQELVDEYVL